MTKAFVALVLLVVVMIDLCKCAPKSSEKDESKEEQDDMCTDAMCRTPDFCQDVKDGLVADDTCAFEPQMCSEPKRCKSEEMCCH